MERERERMRGRKRKRKDNRKGGSKGDKLKKRGRTSEFDGKKERGIERWIDVVYIGRERDGERERKRREGQVREIPLYRNSSLSLLYISTALLQ